ncbi:MAG: corrinoid protein [Armatimonadetes bacterium]|nr:corrinoid protein [Armatimonadota bacterium]
MTQNDLLQKLTQAIQVGDERGAPELARRLLDLGTPPTDITAALAQAMSELGKQFQRLDIFVPDLLIAADAFEGAMKVVTPALLEMRDAGDRKGTIVIGVVEGDIHSLGKDLVRVMLSADGFDVHDLGRDVPAARFVEAAREHEADLIALSALMTTTMDRMRDVIELISAEDTERHLRVIVGGAPVTQQFADEIGAHGYAQDAPRAVALANRLLATEGRR